MVYQPYTCNKSNYILNKENIHLDYIHPSLIDKVQVATTLAAHAATQNNSLLSHGNDSDGPMGPYITTDP
jgi:hypothetical protein